MRGPRARRSIQARGPPHTSAASRSASSRTDRVASSSTWRRPAMPSNVVPSGSAPRHRSARPTRRGSASGRPHRSSRARTRADPSAHGSSRRRDSLDAAPCAPASTAPCRRRSFSFSAGTFGGGGGGGAPRMFSRIHLPRTTGEVRVGIRRQGQNAALARAARRARIVADVTRRKWLPYTFGMP